MHKLVVANYKMNGDKNFYTSIQKKLNKINVKDTNIVLCPPFVYLPFFNLKNKKLNLGCQDIANIQKNKATGQTGPEMLKEFDVKYAIVGHSERRANGETDALVAEKVKIASANNIVPIVCVGEKTKTMNSALLKNQVEKALSLVENTNVIFAYEPLWAIGSGETATVSGINKAVNIIREVCYSLGFTPTVLYGGSVDAKNYKELSSANIDGFLIGGTSLKVDEFISVCVGVDHE